MQFALGFLYICNIQLYFRLLKDIVESSEKPSLSSQDPAYDQFGFRQEELSNPETLEEKAEKLRRMTQVVEFFDDKVI